ncbi:MAG: tyrosine-type recombinase/integrase [Methanobacterium sp.]|jgi:integrase
MEYSSNDIKNDELVKEFFDRVLSETTKRQYILVFKNYSNWRGQLPSEFIEEADIEQNKGIKLKKRKIKRDLIDYINFLKDEGKTQNTVSTYLKCVKALYRDNDIVLPPKLPIAFSKDVLIRNGIEELPTLDDVKILYNAGDLRDKAIILLQLSSGLPASDTRHLTYKDFARAMNLPIRNAFNVQKDIDELKDKKDDQLIGFWTLNRYKTGILFNTFNSPESTSAILTYIEWRIRSKRRKIESYEDYLFTSHYNRKLDKIGFNKIYDRLNDKVGFKRRNNNYRFLTSHQLREIFTTTLFRNRVDKLRVDFLVGHRINQQDSAYFRSNHEDLSRDYLKCLPYLSLENVETKTIESKDVKELKNNYEKRFKAKDNEIAEMEKKIENMGTLMEKLARELQKQKN